MKKIILINSLLTMEGMYRLLPKLAANCFPLDGLYRNAIELDVDGRN
jgi:hypothetical protein